MTQDTVHSMRHTHTHIAHTSTLNRQCPGAAPIANLTHQRAWSSLYNEDVMRFEVSVNDWRRAAVQVAHSIRDVQD